jgi:hypothetical protein
VGVRQQNTEKIIGPKAEEVADKHKNYKKRLRILYAYSSSNIIRVMTFRNTRRAGHIVGIQKLRNVYTILFGKSERKKPFS